ncbi:MAG TPA: site-2 protease family protein [Candidatus Sulfotelmatobacter sp.]|nr:site-2 protease family protein [Candidatus Sulfotelmatobacter sp.]
MKSQIKLGTIFGVELGLHYSWLVIALLITFSLVAQFHSANRNWSAALVWATAIITGVLFFACLFAHELSHALVAKARGLPIHRITLFLLGGVAQIEKEASDPKTEFWMAIVGPFTSGVLGLILLALARVAGWDPRTAPATPGTALLVWLGYINLALGAFNMIPGFPLDGGRVLHAILWWAMEDAERSTRAAAFVGQVIAVLFIGFGIIRFFQGAGLGGLWIAFIGWFLLQAAGASYLQVKAGRLLRGLRVADVMSTDCATIDRSTSVRGFVHEQLLRTGRRCFFVLENDRLVGLITPNEVRTVPAERWPFTTVREVMRPLSSIHSVSRDMPALEALEIMGREDVNQLPVTSEGRVQGIVSRAHLLQVLRSRAELNLPPSLPRAA